MSGWIVWMAALVAMAALLTWRLDREFKRLEREARIKALLKPLSESFGRVKVALGLALLPAMREMVTAAIEAESVMQRLNAQIRDATKVDAHTLDRFERAAAERGPARVADESGDAL